jgi:O-antigen/teichoic acid export membrane protein
LKVVLVIGAVFLGYGVLAAIGGFLATALTLLLLSAAWVYSLVKRDPSRSVNEGHDLDIGKRVLGYMLAIMAYTFALNAIIRADLFLLKSVAAARWGELGWTPDQVSDMSNSLSGLYTGMTNIARLPYSGVIAITFVIFPVISQATFEGDRKAAQSYIRQSLRFSSMFVASMAVVVIACRVPLLRALYPDEYSAGGEALLWLSFGMIAFALFFVATTILISAGKPIHALVLASGTLVVTIALNALLLQTGELGEPMLAQAGKATMAATSAGFLAACIVLHRLFRATVPLGTAVRITISALVIIAVASVVPVENLADSLGGGRLVSMAVVGGKMAFFGLLFYVLMYALREFGAEDRARLRSIFRRRSADSKED